MIKKVFLNNIKENGIYFFDENVNGFIEKIVLFLKNPSENFECKIISSDLDIILDYKFASGKNNNLVFYPRTAVQNFAGETLFINSQLAVVDKFVNFGLLQLNIFNIDSCIIESVRVYYDEGLE